MAIIDFYIKLSASEPQDPFSGETFPIPVYENSSKINRLVESSRKNYALKYLKPVKEVPEVESKEPKKAPTESINSLT